MCKLAFKRSFTCINIDFPKESTIRLQDPNHACAKIHRIKAYTKHTFRFIIIVKLPVFGSIFKAIRTENGFKQVLKSEDKKF